MKVITNKKYVDTEYLEALLYAFCYTHEIRVDTIFLDLRKTKNNYKTDGPFGGFIDMYSRGRTFMYINPYNFVEFDGQIKNVDLIAHLCMHELVHCKQIQNKEMRIARNGRYLRYKGKTYKRAPFRVDIFNRIREYDGALAEEYHASTLPWERDAYKLPEEFMGQPLYKQYDVYDKQA